jgi:hypothetical protein
MTAVSSTMAVVLDQGYCVERVSEHDDGRVSVVVGEPKWYAGSRVSFVGTPAEVRKLAMDLLLAVNEIPTEGTAAPAEAGAASSCATPTGPLVDAMASPAALTGGPQSQGNAA